MWPKGWSDVTKDELKEYKTRLEILEAKCLEKIGGGDGNKPLIQRTPAKVS